jgi:hypothetical protein
MDRMENWWKGRMWVLIDGLVLPGYSRHVTDCPGVRMHILCYCIAD